MRIDIYILNMPQRQERKQSVMQEFADKPEFATHFVRPVKHQIPRISHWLTFYELVKQAQEQNLDCFVFCEDDHIFTSDYEEREFFRQVAEAGRLEADILLGGVSSMKVPIQITDHLFWLYTRGQERCVLDYSETGGMNRTFQNPSGNFYISINKHDYLPYVTYVDTESQYLQNKTIEQNEYYMSSPLSIGYDVTNIYPLGNVVVKNGANLKVKNGQNGILIKNGFECERGGTFVIE